MKFRVVSGHPEDLEDGRLIGAGETFELTAEQADHPHNKAKIEEGNFLEVHEAKKTSRRQRQTGDGSGNQNTDGEGNGDGGDNEDGGNA